MTVRVASLARSGTVVLVTLVAWLILYFGARFLLEGSGSMSRGTRLAVAFVPMPVFALFLALFIGGLRRADELERRIQLEALAVAFPLGLLLLTTLALVQRAVELNPEDWSFSHVWPFFTVFYFLGLAVARRRYA